METKDILGVELLACGTFFGTGSAPEGDTYTEVDLDGIVEAANTIPLKRPVKLGHTKDQNLAQSDGLPAVGWVENLRRVGTKLVGDFRKVAAKVADLIEAGAYRTRSAELLWNYEDSEGTVWPRVLTGVALLGADIPAVVDLDDIVALYENEKGEVHAYTTETTVSDRHEYAVILPLSEKGSYEWVRRQIEEVLPKQAGVWWWIEKTYPEFVVAEKSVDGVLGPSGNTHWIIPYTIDANGAVALGPASEWQQVEEQELFVKISVYANGQDEDDLLAQLSALVDKMETAIKGKQGAPRLRMWVAEAHKGLASIISQQKAAKEPGGAGAPKAAKQNTEEESKVKEHVYALLGLAEDVSEEDALAKLKEAIERPAVDMKAYVAVESPEYKELRTMAEEGRAAKESLYQMERAQVLDKAAEEGKILTADREKWEKRYDASPEMVKDILSEKAPVVDLKEYGNGGGGGEPGEPNERAALDRRVKTYQREHPGTSYELALDIVTAKEG